jgi:hypothetical protein
VRRSQMQCPALEADLSHALWLSLVCLHQLLQPLLLAITVLVEQKALQPLETTCPPSITKQCM